jgi:hypothetical protein
LFWALLASGRINMRKVDGWQTPATSPIDQPIDLAAWSDTISCPETAPRKIPTTSRPAPSSILSSTRLLPTCRMILVPTGTGEHFQPPPQFDLRGKH